MKKIPYEDAIEAWQFIQFDRRLRHFGRMTDDDPALDVAPGYVYSETNSPVVVGINGLHGAHSALVALENAPGPVVCRVLLWGNVSESDNGMIAAQHREVLWMADASRVLREFACWCVRETPLDDGRKVWDLLDDPRSHKAVETAERHARGKAGNIALGRAVLAAHNAMDDCRQQRMQAATQYVAHAARFFACQAAFYTASNVVWWAATDTTIAAQRACACIAALNGAQATQDAVVNAVQAAQAAELERRLLALREAA